METSRLLILGAISCCYHLMTSHVAADGAGRAFPISAENFAVDNFKRVNPLIEWDRTNFLVDLAGFYANCRALDRAESVIEIDRKIPSTMESAVVVIGSIEGSETDVDSANGYIEELLKRWMATNEHDVQIKEADRFGCSVRPGCNGFVVVVCAFASDSDGQKHPPDDISPTTRVRTTPEFHVRTDPPQPFTPPAPVTPPSPPPPGDQIALAFTSQQYTIAENILGSEWDQSHYLENLSGFETVCSMIGTVQWDFAYTKALNQQLGSNIEGQYGYARNRGSTPDALDTILRKFAQVPGAKELGCSIIPDCIDEKDGQMYVVISCLYEN